ncbi:MAG TPA: hypothetical protein VGX51_08950 [Solirubrobacteraceae bacterium]|jgi:hypothetical protein|nr:hypothetical protein [Solirubrobacteraceae bacterium]
MHDAAHSHSNGVATHAEAHSHSNGAGAHDYAARRHPEQVALDIGDTVGALIVHTTGGMHGVEIEISPSEDDARRSHKQVLEREIGGRAAFTAVFDKLAQGSYTLWVDDTARERAVAVSGGEITQLDWS